MAAPALAKPTRAEVPLQQITLPSLDFFLLAGIAIALAATICGLHAAGVSLNYFVQPVAAMIVLGGTLGVMLVTTPQHALINSLRRVMGLLAADESNRAALIEEIVEYARQARRGGTFSIESLIPKAGHPLLRHALELTMDISNRAELRSVLETELQMAERQGESDAKTLEVAGGFAPTLGIIGTVIGLIQVLRQFSNLPSVGYGIGTAFVSTIYGLALANLLLLPLAHRIRARIAEDFDTHELIMEGVLGIADSSHPAVIRMRLVSFLRKPAPENDASKT
ncbi:MAG: MotA/TolQ/ExbB proton channel family protein [Bryobacteraceae bacterium]